LPLGTPEADQLLADLSVEGRNASWHLIVGAETTPRMPAAGAETTSRRPAADAYPAAGASGAAASAGPARFSAGAALSPALALLPHGRVPSALVARIPRLTECGYRWVAEHRGLLGRFVPERARRWADRVIAAHGGSARPQ
jgi:hypothetical protein